VSNWTHVAGVIRLDSIRILGNEEPDFDKIFGKEVRWDADSSVWEEALEHPERFLPKGSEGSLQKEVWVNPDKSFVCAYTVTIFGDLRDHDSPDDIINWFKSKCKFGEDVNLWVRQAAITALNEWYGTKTWTYEED